MDGIKKNTLLMVFSIFRHGDRTPIYIDSENKQPDGAGNLTKNGKIQAYELGKKYRRHYKDFLGADFSTIDVYVYSTDTERSLVSAECCMAGLLPPTERNKWHPTLNWQPVPIHTRHKEDDPFFPALPRSLKIEYLFNEDTRKRYPVWYQHYVDNKDVWDKWLDFTSKDGPSSLAKVCTTIDGIHDKMAKKLPYELPPDVDFMTSITLLENIVALLTEIHPYYKKQGCEFLTKVFEAMNGFIDGSHKMKMFLYSMHDASIASVTAILNMEFRRTRYCGYLTFELHQMDDGKHYVRLHHCQDVASNPHDVLLDGKNVFYPFEKFEEIVKSSQWNNQNVYP